MQSGLILVDKPQGFTSHDVVAKLRKQLGTKKIGHAGTLDPMATGLLLLGVNSGTKLLQFLVGADKQYLATIRLGQSSSTDDAEGELSEARDASSLTVDQIELELSKLRGEISQVPSSVSAIKVDGKRAYDLVREGKEVELKSRQVNIYRFEILGEPKVVGKFVDLDVVVDCSSGTYIRALARDLGAALKVGGHLTALRRTLIGNYSVADSFELGQEAKVTDMVSAARALFELAELTKEQAADIVHGKRIKLSGAEQLGALYQGELLAVLVRSGDEYRSLQVFPEVLNG